MKKVFLILVMMVCLSPLAQTAGKPFVIPALHSWKAASGTRSLDLGSVVCNDSTLYPMGEMLVSYVAMQRTLNSPAGSTEVDVFRKASKGDILLQLVRQKNLGEEGYELRITPDGIHAMAQTPRGILWAVQTIIQLSKEGRVPCGSITDVPEYPLRGFMLDCGRKYIPMSYLRETVLCMSALKMNTLQLHLNDNGFKKYFHQNWDETYAAFRLESEYFPDLTARDGYYTKEEFREFVKWAAQQGVEVIPEIDAPAHALAFTRFRPEYGNEEFGVDHLDLFHPGVVPFLDSLYSEYLGGPDPVFAGPRVHIGTDEYSNKKQETTEKFREFTNHYIRLMKQYGKQPVVWGSLTWSKGKTPVDVDGVLMDMWSRDFADADSMKQLGYRMINIPDAWVYIVPAAGYYYDYLNSELIYNKWTPANINGKVFPEHDPQIEGGMFAVWNDVCGNGISCFDIFHRVRPAMQVIAEKCWSSTVQDFGYQDWARRAEVTHDYMGYRIGELTDTDDDGSLTAYDPQPGTELCFSNEVLLDDVDGYRSFYCLGYDKAVEFLVTGEKEDKGAVLARNDEAEFYLSDPITGRIGYARDGYLFSFDYALRPGERHLLRIECTNKATSLFVDGRLFQTLGPDERLAADKNPYNMIRTLSFPLKETGNFRSKVEYIKVYNGLGR